MIKRITPLLMAVALVLTMSLPAYAAGKVETIEAGVFVESISHTTGSGFDIGKAITSVDGEYLPGDTVNIYLDPSKFKGDGIDFNAKTGVTAKELESAGVSFRFGSGKNTDVIKEVAFKEKAINGNQVALLQVKFSENLVSTESKDFEAKITLYANKVKQQEITIAGTVGSSSIMIEAGEEYVSLAGGEIAEAKENINSIEIDAGKDISLFAKLFKGKKYYARATDSPKDADIELISKHTELELVYYLDTEGFIGSDVSVKIKTPEKLIVYGADGKKLGSTEDRLALSTKYYLATAEVDLGLASNSGSSSQTNTDLDDTDDDIIPTSGDDDVIPDTGVGITANLAVAGVVVSLVMIGAFVVTSKKKSKK